MTDSGTPTRSAVVSIGVSVGAVNEGSPTFSQSIYVTPIFEDAAIGSTVTTITATDVDGNTHPHGTPMYSFISGNTNNLFQVVVELQSNCKKGAM